MGGLLGLQWKDVDWSNHTIHIRRQYNRKGKNENLFSPPKTRSGIRKIKVGPEVMAVLENQSAKVSSMIWSAGENWKDHDLVFPSPTGQPSNDRSILTSFQKLAAQAGIPVYQVSRPASHSGLPDAQQGHSSAGCL